MDIVILLSVKHWQTMLSRDASSQIFSGTFCSHSQFEAAHQLNVSLIVSSLRGAKNPVRC